jgi:hypothetical protein
MGASEPRRRKVCRADLRRYLQRVSPQSAGNQGHQRGISTGALYYRPPCSRRHGCLSRLDRQRYAGGSAAAPADLGGGTGALARGRSGQTCRRSGRGVGERPQRGGKTSPAIREHGSGQSSDCCRARKRRRGGSAASRRRGTAPAGRRRVRGIAAREVAGGCGVQACGRPRGAARAFAVAAGCAQHTNRATSFLPSPRIAGPRPPPHASGERQLPPARRTPPPPLPPRRLPRLPRGRR